MDRLIGKLNAVADTIIFDTPPVGAVTDAAVLGALADGVVLVVEHGRTAVPAIRKVLETLDAIGVAPLGVVLNKAKAGEESDYYYYYYGEGAPSTEAGPNPGGPDPGALAPGPSPTPVVAGVAGYPSAVSTPSDSEPPQQPAISRHG
jgi:hypothetical protein